MSEDYKRAEGNATSEEQYRKEWATKAGRADSDIYIPESIREDDNA